MSTSVRAESTSVTTITTSAPAPVPAYAFLSHPPQQKTRPTKPLPSPPRAPAIPCSPTYARRRSATISAISAWVANVQPGSPAPCSPPRRRTSVSSTRRPSLSRPGSRRPSVSSCRGPSASFLNFFDTPTTANRVTPSIKDFKPDLTAVGYTSVFVHFPSTPVSCTVPAFTDRRPSVSPVQAPLVPRSPVKPRGLQRFRSLSALKSTRVRSKSTTMRGGPSPPLHTASPVPKAVRQQSNAAVSKTKKSKYAKYRPPPLGAELALAQFADGGKMDDHIRRFQEQQARAAGATVVNGQLVGVGGVWRDGTGGVWRDQDEEWEYAHLLGGEEDFSRGDKEWVRFAPGAAPRSVEGEEDEERRGSVSSQDSDLDPRYAMQPEADSRDDLAAFGSALAPMAVRKPGMSVLAIPSRSRRTAKHLRKPEFLLDVFPIPQMSTTEMPGAETKARRRPAPLTLSPPSPVFKCPTNPADAEQVRRDFLENSFAPPPPPKSAVPALPRVPMLPIANGDRAAVARKVATTKPPGGLNVGMRGLLRAMGGKKMDI